MVQVYHRQLYNFSCTSLYWSIDGFPFSLFPHSPVLREHRINTACPTKVISNTPFFICPCSLLVHIPLYCRELREVVGLKFLSFVYRNMKLRRNFTGGSAVDCKE